MRPNSSRTGTTRWMKVRDQRRTQALNDGIHNCPTCNVWLDWEYTRQPNSAEVDHIIPAAQGGQDKLDNTRITCRKCNQQSGGRLGASRSGPPPRTRVITGDLDTTINWGI